MVRKIAWLIPLIALTGCFEVRKDVLSALEPSDSEQNFSPTECPFLDGVEYQIHPIAGQLNEPETYGRATFKSATSGKCTLFSAHQLTPAGAGLVKDLTEARSLEISPAVYVSFSDAKYLAAAEADTISAAISMRLPDGTVEAYTMCDEAAFKNFSFDGFKWGGHENRMCMISSQGALKAAARQTAKSPLKFRFTPVR